MPTGLETFSKQGRGCYFSYTKFANLKLVILLSLLLYLRRLQAVQYYKYIINRVLKNAFCLFIGNVGT